MRAVLFDWGGTLSVHHQVDVLATWAAAAAVLRPTDSAALAADLLAAEAQWWERCTLSGDASGTTELILRAVVPGAHDADIQVALAAYHAAWEATVEHDAAAVEVLTGLRERGLRTGLLSNTHWPRALHERWLEKDGLLSLLDARVYTSDLQHLKPHAAAFAALLNALDVPAGDAVFVGDRLRDDVWGAQQVGMRTVLLTGRPTPSHDVVPDASVPDLRDVLAVIDAWR